MKYAAECPPCEGCGEPWCPDCEVHYADCACPGPHSEPEDFRENPYRTVAGQPTRTWLPDDAGRFDFADNTLQWRPARTVRASLEDEARGAPRDPRVVPPHIVLPDGREVALEQIGKGHFTTAYAGEDGWVYLLTTEDERKLRDPAKDILVELVRDTADRSFAIHYPWVERIGSVHLPRRGWMTVYREPRYQKLTPGSPASKQAHVLGAIKRYRNQQRTYEWKQAIVGAVKEAPGLPPTLVEAVEFLSDYMVNWGEGWVFEFPRRNLVEDPDGNLVLLDVIFDADAPQRMAAWRRP